MLEMKRHDAELEAVREEGRTGRVQYESRIGMILYVYVYDAYLLYDIVALYAVVKYAIQSCYHTVLRMLTMY